MVQSELSVFSDSKDTKSDKWVQRKFYAQYGNKPPA
jgi:hypothetical protein